jgi:two-component system, NarL family, nitrate/nitrite response regulator NarL
LLKRKELWLGNTIRIQDTGYGPFSAQDEYCRWVMRILIVDDHEVVRRGLRALLETQREWKVCGEAEDGMTAVEQTKALHPDIVILDVSMPKLSGFGAAKLIRELCPKTPILLYSMYHSPAFLDEARRIGVTGYVAKTEDGPTFLMAVDAVQRNRPFFAT